LNDRLGTGPLEGAVQRARFWRGVLTTLVTLGVALFAVANARADTERTSDGNDRPGPLDIRSATHGHDGDRVVHTISTFGRWRNGLLAPKDRPNLFAVEISTDGDRALERVVLIYSRNGSMVARVFRVASGRRLVLVGPASASRPNARTVRVSIARARLGGPTGYRWKAHSQYEAAGECSDFCIDKAPNSGRVLHDITAPRIVFPSPRVPASTEYDVNFRVSDWGGSGLRSWRLQHRPFGGTTWSTVANGTTEGSKSYHRVEAEDADDEFRVVALDRQGTTNMSPIRLVSVPFDDTNPSFIYGGTWAQDWAVPQDFLGTLHTSNDGNASMSYSFVGSYVAIVARGLCGWGPVRIDGGPPEQIAQLCVDEKRAIVYSRTLSPGPHTLVWTIGGGVAAFDGIIVR
jgi:hypothetical protein